MSAPEEEPDRQMSEVDFALEIHNGDARSAIATLIDDLHHLRRQLALADAAISRGLTRGWRPDVDRE